MKITERGIEVASVGLTMVDIGNCKLCPKDAEYRVDLADGTVLGLCDKCLHSGRMFGGVQKVINKYFVPMKYN